MAAGPIWTPEEAEFIAHKVVREGVTNSEMVAAFQERWPDRRSASALMAARTKSDVVREAIERATADRVRVFSLGEYVPGVTDEPPPEVRSKMPPEDYSAAKMWDRAKRETRIAREFQRDRHKAEIVFQTRRPVALAFISDQHIAQSGPVNLDRMEQDAAIVRDTPGLYGVLGGDGVDNHIKHRSAMINSGSVPGKEWAMYDHYLGMFGRKLAAVISGNHDDWTHDFAGVDVIKLMAERRRFFYAPDLVVLTVRLQEPGAEDEEGVGYAVKVRHQYRYSSSFNQTHSVKRMWEMDEDDFDVGVVCHKHEVGMEPFRKHGQTRWAFRPGSYQEMTAHSRRYGYGAAVPSCPTIILFPGTRYMIGFEDVRQAASYLTWLRQGWPDTGLLFEDAG